MFRRLKHALAYADQHIFTLPSPGQSAASPSQAYRVANKEVWSTAFSLHTERKVFPSSVVLYNHLAKCTQHRQWVLRKHAVESLVFRKVRQIPTHVRRIVAVLSPAMYTLIINCNPIMAAGKFENRRIPHSSHAVFAEEPLKHEYRVPYFDIACPGVLNAARFRI